MIERRLYPSRALHGRVAHDIGRRIVSGEIGQGDSLPREQELSEQFSVSRQAVREALKVLAAKGLVNSRRRIGTYVLPRASWNLLDPDVLAWHPPTKLTPEFMRNLIELRQLIEPAAAAFAAKRGDRESIARIGVALDNMRRSTDDHASFDAADAAFHVAIFAASGNSLIDRLSDILGPLLRASLLVQELIRHGDNSDIVRLHVDVYEAIVAGDAVRARRQMEHLLSVASDEVHEAVRGALSLDSGAVGPP